MYSKEYLMAKVTYLEGELAKLPKVKLGKSQGRDIVYVYTNAGDKVTRNRYFTTSKKGIDYLEVYKQIENTRNELKKLYTDHEFLISDKRVSIKPVKLLPYSLRENLVPDSNPMPKTGDYWFKDTQMRSRLEIVTALVLESMGLEFMYEPCITIYGDDYYPDFVVFLPELGCCFIIECLGIADDRGYLFKNTSKLVDYIHIGFDINLNYLLFRGTVKYIPDPSMMKSDIEHLINNLARSVVVA